MAHEKVTHDIENVERLDRSPTVQSVSMTMEMFEKLYLTPQNKVKGELRRTFANPTPVLVTPLLPKPNSLILHTSPC